MRPTPSDHVAIADLLARSCVALPVVEMTAPDRARTTRNLLFVDRETGASRRAVYTDELQRTAEGWRIAYCRCRFIVAAGLADRPDA